MSREEIIGRGMAAARLLGDATLMKALTEIEAECMAAWTGSNPADITTREDAYRMTRCVGLLRQKLEAWRGAIEAFVARKKDLLARARMGSAEAAREARRLSAPFPPAPVRVAGAEVGALSL